MKKILNKINNWFNKNFNTKSKKIIIVVLSIILVLIIGVTVGANVYINSLLNKMNQTDAFDSDDVYAYENDYDVVNILLLGIDAERDDGTEKSDAMKIISLDNETNQIKITSLQRDNLVYLPLMEMYNNLNWAYLTDGIEGALATINYNFDLDLTQYVAFEFDSVEEVVDIIGGVTIYVSDAEAGYISGISSGGTYLLNGSQTLEYMRIRSIDSDYVRMERQEYVIITILQSVTQMDVLDIIDLINECMPFIETNISNSDIKDYLITLLTYDLSEIPTAAFPSDGYGSILKSLYLYGYGPHYVLEDFIGEVELIHEHIYENVDYEPSENVEKTDADTKELAGY